MGPGSRGGETGGRRLHTGHGTQVRLGLISADLDIYGDTSAPSGELCWRRECTAPAAGVFSSMKAWGRYGKCGRGKDSWDPTHKASFLLARQSEVGLIIRKQIRQKAYVVHGLRLLVP